MKLYNKILKSIVTWILTILLVSIFCTSVLIYPPFSFISHMNAQEKTTLINNMIVPSAMLLLCSILENIYEKKNIILIVITLVFNIVMGLTIKLFDMTKASYFIANINFNLIPACFVVMTNVNVNGRIQLKKILLYISFVVQAVLYLVFIYTAIMGSYVFVAGLMYLSLPIVITANIIVYLNANLRLLKLRTVISIYAVNVIFIAYNTFWVLGNGVISVLNAVSVVIVIVTVIFAVIDIKNILKRCCNLK